MKNLRRLFKSPSKKLLALGIITFTVLTVGVCFLPVIIVKNSIISLGVSSSNEIGDTIGGIMSPIVGLIGAALTFFAFWAQYDANLEQRRQYLKTLKAQKRMELRDRKKYEDEKKESDERYANEQKIQLEKIEQQKKRIEENRVYENKLNDDRENRARIERFETRFYSMLNIHRDNVNELDFSGIKGRKVFMEMFDELKIMYWLIKDICKINGIATGDKISEDEIYQIVYLSFFFGIGYKSTPLVTSLVGDHLMNITQKIHSQFYTHKNNLIASIEDRKIAPKKDMYDFPTESGQISFNIDKKLGQGHLRRYSHYIRHIFQTVKFVDEQDDKLLTYHQKYQYLSNLRAQLSTNEQLLLYYNALSILGEPWLENFIGNENYIQKYCLIKSIPLDSADFYKSPTEIFPEYNSHNKPIFEWLEIKSRMLKISSHSIQ